MIVPSNTINFAIFVLILSVNLRNIDASSMSTDESENTTTPSYVSPLTNNMSTLSPSTASSQVEKQAAEGSMYPWLITNDEHEYYNSRVVIDRKREFQKSQLQMIYFDHKTHGTLSNHHRLALQVDLKFAFPFYGHSLKRIAIATGGFLYMSDFLHKYLTYTQYVAPLMGDFDSSLGNESAILYTDTGSSFHVLWKNLLLPHDSPDQYFTFSAALFENGSICFSYYQLPPMFSAKNHSFEVGISDAYYEDDAIMMKRKIIEYHRVQLPLSRVALDMLIWLDPLPTCVAQSECQSCLSGHTVHNCSWCPSAHLCSSGLDRNRQRWHALACHRLIPEERECKSDTNHKAMIPLLIGLVVLVAVLVILMLIFMYAYTHPHSSMGICLITYRPSTYRDRLRALRSMLAREDKFEVSFDNNGFA